MLIGVPISIGIAIFLTEICPMWLRRPIGIAIELLAGIPSIIYGIWGLFVFAPFMQQHVQPALIAIFGHIPLLSDLFSGPPYGRSEEHTSELQSIMRISYAVFCSNKKKQTK